MEETEENVLVTDVEISEINASKMADLDCSTVNKIFDTKEAVPNDGISSRSESFFEHCYRSEEQEMSKNTRIEESQAKENDDIYVATGSDLYCGRFKSVPSLPPSLKEYFDMVTEEYCKKLKTKKKSKSGNRSGKPNSSLKGVFFNEPTKRIVAPKIKSIETMIPSEETQHKNKGNEWSGIGKTNSNEAKLVENSKKAALRGSLNRSNTKLDQVIDLNRFEGDFESTQSENAKQAVSVLVSYFENLRRPNSKQKQKKIPEDRGEKKVLETAKTEVSPHMRNESIHFLQSTVTKKKHKNKIIEVRSSENAVASSSSEASNTKSIVNDLSRCWINKNNSYPNFVFNDCITTGSSIHRNISKNRTKRSKLTTINLKSPSSAIQTLGKKANLKLQRSKSKKQKETKCKRGNNAKTSTKNLNKQPRMLSQINNKIGKKKNYSTKTFQAVATVFVGMIAFVLAAAVMRSANE